MKKIKKITILFFSKKEFSTLYFLQLKKSVLTSGWIESITKILLVKWTEEFKKVHTDQIFFTPTGVKRSLKGKTHTWEKWLELKKSFIKLTEKKWRNYSFWEKRIEKKLSFVHILHCTFLLREKNGCDLFVTIVTRLIFRLG